MSQFDKEWMMDSNKNVLVAVQLKEVDSPQRLRMMNRNMKLCLAVISLARFEILPYGTSDLAKR